MSPLPVSVTYEHSSRLLAFLLSRGYGSWVHTEDPYEVYGQYTEV